MLDPCAADLIDTVARLCVLRTEDYTLLSAVFKRERGALAQLQSCDGAARSAPSSTNPAAYVRYLTEEVQRREEERCAAERRWCESARKWACSFARRQPTAPLGFTASTDISHIQVGGTSADARQDCPSFPIWTFWHPMREEGDRSTSFAQMYAAVIRHAYELKGEDLRNTPFTQLKGSAYLYTSAANVARSSPHASPCHDAEVADNCQKTRLSGLSRVHSLFFSTPVPDASIHEPSSPTVLLCTMHPLHDEDAVIKMNRTRLASSRHVWLVLFFLWCHAVSASSATPSSADAKVGNEEAWEQWLVETTLLEPAITFLHGQSQQLDTLLTKARDACGS